MKIALVHYSCAPVIGGVETILAAHARLFTAAGHQVRIIVRRGGEGDPRVVLLRAAEPLEELRAAIADCDVVIAHNVMTMPFDMALTAALQTVAREHAGTRRFIAWVHDLAACSGDYPLPFHEPPWIELTRALPGFEYIAISEHRAKEFQALTGRPAEVIPNGIEPAEVLGFPPAVTDFARAHALFERDIILFQPARLLPRKNIELGLSVTAELRASGRNAAYLITAAPNPFSTPADVYPQALQARRSDLGLDDHVFFLSDHFAVTSTELTALYALAHAIFLPSLHEGFGLPLLEAVLHRVPVFTSDQRPMNMLLGEMPHLFSPSATAAEVATKIARTLDLSAPHRARREVLERYAWAKIDREFLQPLLAGTISMS